MKTLKNILLLVCLISFSNLKAQDETNDATWQETITFINKYKSYISSGEVYNCLLSRKEYWNASSVTISNSYFKIKLSDGQYYRQYNLPLKNLSYYSSGTLMTTGKNIDENYYLLCNKIGEQRGQSKKSEIIIYVQDSEIRPRISKAFQHLAYLAMKERDEKRKNSGEKF